MRLVPGVYRLVVKVTDMKSAASAYQSLNFEVRDKAQPVAALWTVDVPGTNSGLILASPFASLV